MAHDPVSVLGYAWAAALERAGIQWIKRTAPPAIWPALPSVLAKVESAPFDSVAIEINRRSLNIGAELVLQWAAASQTTGPALLTQHVRDVVGPAARVHLVDGSGLSELGPSQPAHPDAVPGALSPAPGAERFPLLLPANGVGTLRRLRYGMGKGVVHAKTGTLDRVAALAGYLGRRDGVLVISLMYNGPRIHAARAAEWELFRLLGAEGVDLSGALETQMGGEDRPTVAGRIPCNRATAGRLRPGGVGMVWRGAGSPAPQLAAPGGVMADRHYLCLPTRGSPPRQPDDPGGGMDSTARQARLKPEFASLYPPLTPDVWEPAAEMGARVLLWQVQQQGTAALGTRLLDEQHFEFRGGWFRGEETDLRTRVCDPAFNGPV